MDRLLLDQRAHLRERDAARTRDSRRLVERRGEADLRSSPLPDAVTRSTGTGSGLSGSAACSASTRLLTAASSAGLFAPRFDPPEARPLFGIGVVADGRPQKCVGALND